MADGFSELFWRHSVSAVPPLSSSGSQTGLVPPSSFSLGSSAAAVRRVVAQLCSWLIAAGPFTDLAPTQLLRRAVCAWSQTAPNFVAT